MDTTKGYIALTDPDWYQYLSSQPRLDEVNFWQPHGDHVFRALSPGETFFFKLRAPHRAIGSGEQCPSEKEAEQYQLDARAGEESVATL